MGRLWFDSSEYLTFVLLVLVESWGFDDVVELTVWCFAVDVGARERHSSRGGRIGRMG